MSSKEVGALRATRKIHRTVVHRLLHAAMDYFDVTPIGRIVNRCIKDVGDVDDVMPAVLRFFWENAFQAFMTIGLLSWVAPLVHRSDAVKSGFA